MSYTFVIFNSEPIEYLLNETKEIYLDETFKVVPNLPSSQRLMIFLAMKNEHVNAQLHLQGQI